MMVNTGYLNYEKPWLEKSYQLNLSVLKNFMEKSENVQPTIFWGKV